MRTSVWEPLLQGSRERGLEARHTLPRALLPQAPPPRPLNHLQSLGLPKAEPLSSTAGPQPVLPGTWV